MLLIHSGGRLLHPSPLKHPASFQCTSEDWIFHVRGWVRAERAHEKFPGFWRRQFHSDRWIRGGVSKRTPTPESWRLRGTNHDEEPTNDSPPNPSTALHSKQLLSDQPDHQPRATDYEATPVNSRPAHQIDAGHTRLPTTSSANYFSFPNNH